VQQVQGQQRVPLGRLRQVRVRVRAPGLKKRLTKNGQFLLKGPCLPEVLQ